MVFNQQTFTQIAALINAATEATATAVQQWGSQEHLQAVETVVGTAGAITAASTTDVGIQQEATAATQLAVTLLPAIFAFANLFTHKAS